MSVLGKLNHAMRLFGIVLVKTIDDDLSVSVKWSVWRSSTYDEMCDRVIRDGARARREK